MKPKQLFITICLLGFAITTMAQEYNPYKSIGKKAKILTLSHGKYLEFFDTDSIQRIGTVMINTRTKKIVKLLKEENVYQTATDYTSVSRWYSIDPLAEKFSSISPYVYAVNNPVLFVDPDGQEIWINYGDNQKVKYDNGKLYNDKGEVVTVKDDFVRVISGYLDIMGSTDLGKAVVDDLASSTNVYSYANETVKDENGNTVDAMQFQANSDNKGGTIKAGYMMTNAEDAKKLDGFSHETFHGYQQNNGETKNDVGREVSANLFSQGVLNNVLGGDISKHLGNNTKAGQAFVQSFQKALYSPVFDQAAYNKAVNTFKTGSIFNSSGTYNNLPTQSKNSTNALIRLYPLVKKK
jgi:hypothetical protein